jgi:sodium/bile acid cotransporter 7
MEARALPEPSGRAAPVGIKRAVINLRARAIKQCLPIGLILAFVFGLSVPFLGIGASSGEVLGFGVLQTLCVWLIFFISGLTLKTEEAVQALHARRAIAFALLSILGATTSLAPLMAMIPPPFPREFAVGFTLFCVMPTTINVGIALTFQAQVWSAKRASVRACASEPRATARRALAAYL